MTADMTTSKFFLLFFVSPLLAPAILAYARYGQSQDFNRYLAKPDSVLPTWYKDLHQARAMLRKGVIFF